MLGVGLISYLFGMLFKFLANKHRKYLADAYAVQYTRDDNSITGVLEKIKEEDPKEINLKGDAFSLLFFSNKVVMFNISTHPSLEKRIEAIQGHKYIAEEWGKL